MIRYLFRRLGKSERGATMIEFAIVALLLFFLIFGIMEFAWILLGHITLTGAVREGARQAVVSHYSGISENDIKKVVMDHAWNLQFSEADIEVDLESSYGQETSVEVKEAELPLLTGIFPFISNPYVISEVKATMMHE